MKRYVILLIRYEDSFIGLIHIYFTFLTFRWKRLIRFVGVDVVHVNLLDGVIWEELRVYPLLQLEMFLLPQVQLLLDGLLLLHLLEVGLRLSSELLQEGSLFRLDDAWLSPQSLVTVHRLSLVHVCLVHTVGYFLEVLLSGGRQRYAFVLLTDANGFTHSQGVLL